MDHTDLIGSEPQHSNGVPLCVFGNSDQAIGALQNQFGERAVGGYIGWCVAFRENPCGHIVNGRCQSVPFGNVAKQIRSMEDVAGGNHCAGKEPRQPIEGEEGRDLERVHPNAAFVKEIRTIGREKGADRLRIQFAHRAQPMVKVCFDSRTPHEERRAVKTDSRRVHMGSIQGLFRLIFLKFRFVFNNFSGSFPQKNIFKRQAPRAACRIWIFGCQTLHGVAPTHVHEPIDLVLAQVCTTNMGSGSLVLRK